MATFLHDVLLLEEDALVQIRIEVWLHLGIGQVCRPAHEMVHTLLRPIGIVNLQTVALGYYVIANLLQTVSGRPGEQGCRFLVAVNASSHEIVRTVIAYLQNNVRYNIGQSYKLNAVFCGINLVASATGDKKKAANKAGGKRPTQECSHYLMK